MNGALPKDKDEEELRCLDAALALAAQAGALLMEGAGRVHASTSKSTATDLVTEFDAAAEALVVRGLLARFPDHAILGEEGGAQGAAAARVEWLVDPLDGTVNFAHGLPFFSVSLGCVIDGEVRAGVVHAPALGMTFAARRGAGATLGGRRLQVSQTAELSRALLSTGFPYDRHTARENNFAQFVRLQRRAGAVRRLGSAALDLSFVAAGWLDGYWEMKLKPWDIAAGLLLVREAGGQLSDWAGAPQPTRALLQRGEVLASNGHIHGAVAQVLRETEHGVYEA